MAIWIRGDRDATPVLDAAKEWCHKCLVNSGSVFTDDEIWTRQGLDILHEAIVENPIVGPKPFSDKLARQLSRVPASAKQLAAEIIWLLFLFPSNIKQRTKQEQVTYWLSHAGVFVPISHRLLGPVLQAGIGSTGQAFNQKRIREVTFIIDFARSFKALPRARQSGLLTNPWAVANWTDSIEDALHRQMRHVLLYLLFPECFERISVTAHKRQIVEAYGGLLSGVTDHPRDSELVGVDRKLLHIRQRLEQKSGSPELDFYQPEIRSHWYSYTRRHSVTSSREFRLPEELPDNTECDEGLAKAVLVNVYERSAKARKACIEHYGVECTVCGFNFETVYGKRGTNYIHVHHLVPIAEAKKPYKLDAVRDLRPVCPNCHAMLHVDPLLTPDGLRLLVSGRD